MEFRTSILERVLFEMIIALFTYLRSLLFFPCNKSLVKKRLIKPLLVVRVGPGTNPKYGSYWTESLIATWRNKKKKSNPNVDSWYHE